MRHTNLFFKAVIALLLSSSATAYASDAANLARYHFFYAGESKHPRMFIVKDGNIDWRHTASDRKGAVPGRVAWVHAPGVANWDGRTGLWVEDRWNDQRLADAMVSETIALVGGKDNAKEGWDAMFRYFNDRHGKGNKGHSRFGPLPRK